MRVVKNHHMDLLSSRRHGGYTGNAMRVLAIRCVSWRSWLFAGNAMRVLAILALAILALAILAAACPGDPGDPGRSRTELIHANSVNANTITLTMSEHYNSIIN
jgi:hypothetical protein